MTTARPYCDDQKSVDYSREVDFVVLLYNSRGGLQAGGALAADALRGSPVGGLDVTVETGVAEPIYAVTVRILERCRAAATWLIVGYAFDIRGANEIKIVVGDEVALNWVSQWL